MHLRLCFGENNLIKSLYRYGELFDGFSVFVVAPINIGAFFVFGKQLLSAFNIGIYLPAANVFASLGIVYEPQNILGRIAQKKPYFMRKIIALAHL